jgi:hypothetical protein
MQSYRPLIFVTRALGFIPSGFWIAPLRGLGTILTPPRRPEYVEVWRTGTLLFYVYVALVTV